MKPCFLGLFVLLSGWALAQPSVPEIPFESASNFFKLPADINFGETAGVAVKGRPVRESSQTPWVAARENTIFAAEILNWRVQKLTLHPAKAVATDGANR